MRQLGDPTNPVKCSKYFDNLFCITEELIGIFLFCTVDASINVEFASIFYRVKLNCHTFCRKKHILIRISSLQLFLTVFSIVNKLVQNSSKMTL